MPDPRGAERSDAEAAYVDVALAGSEGGRRDTGQELDELLDCRDVQLRECLAGEGLDRQRDVLQAFRAALRGDDHFLESTTGRCLRPDNLSRAGGKHGGYRGCESVIHALSDPQSFVLSTQRPPLAGARYPL